MSDTSKRELIERTAYERYPDIEADPPGTSAEDARFPTGWSREQERNAFIAGAVFEQAHTPTTPTDDEREVLLVELSAWQKHTGDAALANLLRRAASAIRRTAVQEPQIGCPHWSPGRITIRKGCTACAAESEPQGEPTDAPTVQLVARRGGKVQAMIDSMLAQANERGIRVEVVYPQGEPTDAQVLAALNAYYADYMIGPNKSLSEVRPPRTVHDMRAALRAAAATQTGEQA